MAMHFLPNLLLLLITIVGGCLPIFTQILDECRMKLLLAFSGSFLLGITCLHLLPETFADLPTGAGPYLLIGFFLQLLIQRVTHGIEHGHLHTHTHSHSIPVFSILAGLSLHAAMEGIPLGMSYRHSATNPALFLAIGAHKLPEAMLLGALLHQVYSKKRTFMIMFSFSLITPLAALLSTYLASYNSAMTHSVSAVIPVVAGAFIHISTTIFFESGTQHHMLTRRKVATMMVGLSVVALTLFLE